MSVHCVCALRLFPLFLLEAVNAALQATALRFQEETSGVWAYRV